MVKDGGSAVDSAIATMFCIGATMFQSAGIGGGHFMTVYGRYNTSRLKVIKLKIQNTKYTSILYISNRIEPFFHMNECL